MHSGVFVESSTCSLITDDESVPCERDPSNIVEWIVKTDEGKRSFCAVNGPGFSRFDVRLRLFDALTPRTFET